MSPSTSIFRLRCQTSFSLTARGGDDLLLLCPPEASDARVFHLAWGPGLAALWTQRGGCVLHGSCVRLGTSAFSFIGPSGRGKSTLAAGLKKRGFDFVSDGMTLITAEGLGQGAPSRSLRVERAELPDGPLSLTELFERRGVGLPEIARDLEAHLARAQRGPLPPNISPGAEGAPAIEGYRAYPGPSWFKLDDTSLVALGHEPRVLPFVHSRVRKRLVDVPSSPQEHTTPPRLACVFVLEDGDRLEFSLVHGTDKLKALVENMYLTPFMETVEPSLFRQAAAIAREVPVARLRRPRGFERASEVLDFVEARVAEVIG